MADFFIDHSLSGTGANDGTSGSGAWWGFRSAFLEENTSAEIAPGDYVWARRVVSGSPGGELVTTGYPTVTPVFSGTPDDVVNIVRWPASGEPDYLMRPSGSMADWDSDGDTVYPTVRIDGSTGPSSVFNFNGDTGSDPSFIRWRGLEIWSGTGGDTPINVFRAWIWLEDIHFFGGEGDNTDVLSVNNSVVRAKDCEWGHATEDSVHRIVVSSAALLFLGDCKTDSDAAIYLMSTGGGNVYLRNHLDNTRAGTGEIVVSYSTIGGRQNFYSRNGTREQSTFIDWGTSMEGHAGGAIEEGEVLGGKAGAPSTVAWDRFNTQGRVAKSTTTTRGNAEFSLNVLPGFDTPAGPYMPLSIFDSAPHDEFSGIPLQVFSGSSYEVCVYMHPERWTVKPDLSVELPARRGECWVEVEYYTGSGTTRKSSIKYSFSESQTPLVDDTWTPVKVSGILPSEDSWLLVRAFLGKDEAGGQNVLVDPNIELNRS